MAAFGRAAQLGADAVELDVRTTADGQLVIHHDPHLADGRSIVEVAATELPEHVPTLASALDACAGMWVNVEIKNEPGEADFDVALRRAEQTVVELAGRGEDERWVISSFHLPTIDRCREVKPSIRTAWLTHQPTLPPEQRSIERIVAVLAERGHHAWHPWVGSLTAAEIGACHDAGLQVNTWTCDDPRRMAELIRWGIDGICTNVPDVALTVRGGDAG